MTRGPIPLKAHATLEPFAALVLIAAPWIFGFSDVTSATIVSIAAGVAILATGAMTRWRWSLVKLIPLRTHFMADVGLGLVLILSPFIFGFSDEGGATRFMVVAGVLELLAALSTRWDPREADAPRAHRRPGRSSGVRAAR
jgi:hypothetical protein